MTQQVDFENALRILADAHLGCVTGANASTAVLTEKLISFSTDDVQDSNHSLPTSGLEWVGETQDDAGAAENSQELDGFRAQGILNVPGKSLPSKHRAQGETSRIQIEDGVASTSSTHCTTPVLSARERTVGRHVALAMSKKLGKEESTK